jgi:hypothetical protein
MPMHPKLTTAVLFLLFAHSGIAQVNEMGSNTVRNEPGNRYFNYRTQYDNIGSPYFLDEYQEAELTSSEGKVYKNIKVKVDLETNEVLFLNEEGKEMVTTMPVWRVRFSNKILVSIGGQPLNTPKAPICQVLDTGHCILLKQIRVTHADKTEQQKAVITRRFMQAETYYIMLQNGSPQKLSPGKDDLIKGLKDKDVEITAFIDQNKLKCRSEADYSKVVQYYNSLYQASLIKTM